MKFINGFDKIHTVIFNHKRKLVSKLSIALLLCLSLGFSLLINQWQSQPMLLESSIDSLPLATVADITEPVAPLPLWMEGLNPEKVSLGEQLFADTRLSSDNTVSCLSCHNLQQGGVDRKEISIGINNTKGKFNAPTVFNSGFNFRQFWDGRAESLEAQIDGPILSDQEMGSSWSEVVRKLQQDKNYGRQFQKIYGSLQNKKINM